MAMGMVLVVAAIQIVAGDLHGLNTLEHQRRWRGTSRRGAARR
jgi:cytochrome bd-type quinol oxidase subunit 1